MIVKLHRNNLEFELRKAQSFTTSCPKCSAARTKRNALSLSVYRDEDGKIRYVCHHPGCEWNKWQSCEDPSPGDVVRVEEAKTVLKVPEEVSIPAQYNTDTLYWYRNLEGQYLFANRRIDFEGGKVYVPFIWTEHGFQTGKGTKWPLGFTGLYGEHTIPGATRAVIVEGEKAAEGAKRFFPNAAIVSWLGGSNRGFETADWNKLDNMESILLWPDNDEPGKKVMSQIARLLRSPNIKIANTSDLPSKADLADDLTHEQVRKAVSEGTVFGNSISGVFTLDDIKKQVSSMGPPRKSGYEVFDAHTKLPSSGLVVVEGRTKHGKSALAISLTSRMLQEGLESKILFYSYEMTAAKVFGRYLKTLDPEASLDNLDGSSNEVINWVNESKLNIVDQSSQLSIGEIAATIAKPYMRGSVVVLDYLQIIPISAGSYRASRQLMIKEMLDEIRVIAHKNNVLVLVLSQLTPDYLNPRNDSPREAKDIHYSADLVLRIWNKSVGEFHPNYNELPGDYFVHVYLNREGESNVLFEGSLEHGSRLSIKRRSRKS